jgi:hypothetical protein
MGSAPGVLNYSLMGEVATLMLIGQSQAFQSMNALEYNLKQTITFKIICKIIYSK